LTVDELSVIEQKLLEEGLDLVAPLQLGTGEWPNTLRIKFRAAPYSKGVGQLGLPLAVMIILAVGAVGITGILGWTIREILLKNFPLVAGLALFGIILYAKMKEAR
jgi:predicted membrane protein